MLVYWDEVCGPPCFGYLKKTRRNTLAAGSRLATEVAFVAVSCLLQQPTLVLALCHLSHMGG